MIDGINFRADAKRFTHKMMQKNNIMLIFLCKLGYYHLGQSGTETQVFLEYLSGSVFRSDDSERFNL